MSTRKHLNPRLTKNENGFAIPIAVGMGLIMILLATTAVIKAQNDKISAVSKKDANASLYAAENGISRIQAFLNQYRSAANAPACLSWSGVTCTDTAVVSWAVPAELSSTLNAECSATETLANAQTAVSNAASREWVAVDTTDTTKGEYRLVEYTAPTSSLGVLVVEGRATATSDTSVARLKVDIPIFPSTDGQTPAIWAKTSVEGNPQVNGYVMGSCTGTVSASFPSGSNYSVLRNRLDMPAIPPQPTTGTTPPSIFYTLNKISDLTSSPRQLPRAADTAAGTPADTPDTDGVYKYVVTTLDESFAIDPSKSVQIWVAGNIDLSGKVIVNACGSSTDCGPFDARIYGTGSTGSTLTLDANTRICDVFFQMPTYDVTFNSSGSGTAPTQDCGAPGSGTKNTGIYWVNKWNGSGSGTIVDSPRAKWSSAPIQPPPRIGPVKNWEPQSSD
jgi:hypothetical protein